MNSRNACCHSVQNLLSSNLLSKNLKIKIYKTIILPVALYGCETWSLALRKESRLMVFEKMVLRKIQGGPNITGTDLCVNKPHCAAAVRPSESEATTSTLSPARVRTCSVLSGSC